ncbi:MAG TPA: ABC transporter permease subunit [Dongiaceae bacterium]|jgi:ABC-type spermidine/putrescine transport system permease subunit I|nr:ABC transporter permease subunit [Dongiaceae bacterium]
MTAAALADSGTPGASGARGVRARRRALLRAALLVAPALAMVAIFIVVPAVMSMGGTFFVGGKPSLANYQDFFGNPQSVQNLRFTVGVTLISVGILLVAGLTIALYLRFSHTRLVGAIQILALFPLFVPSIVASFALIRFLGPAGWVPTLLRLVGITAYQTPYLHASGAVIGLVWQELPMTVLMLMAGLAQVSNRSIEAARDCGAGSTTIFVHIVLPQIFRSVVVAGCIGFLDIIGSFTVPYILGPAAPQMMSIYMQRSFSELHRAAASETQATVTFLVCILVGAIYTAFVFRDSVDNAELAK